MDAVEYAFRLQAEGKVERPKILGIHVEQGGFHIKAGAMNSSHHYFVAKMNANFPGNKKNNLPTIQGVIIVSNGENGKLLALLDSIEITIIRTGAATGVAAKYLSRKDSKVATICGCGNQGRISLKALLQVRELETVFAFDVEPYQSKRFAAELSKELNISIEVVNDLSKAARSSDIIVTCTPSKTALVKTEDVKPGTFIAAVGADSEDKQEIDSSLLASSKIVVDLLEQASTIGELHHGIKNGLVTQAHVHAELGEIIAGHKRGRTSEDEIIIFDSTGMALQDVAASAIVYEKALEQNIGMTLNFNS